MRRSPIHERIPSATAAAACAAALTVALATAAPPARGNFVPAQAQALAALRADSAIAAEVRFERGYPAFARMVVYVPVEDPVQRAETFLAQYADLYLLDHPEVALVHARTEADPNGDGELVRFGQEFAGYPVHGAELVVHTAVRQGEWAVTATTGSLLIPALFDRETPTDLPFDAVPAIPAALAEDAARDALERPGAATQGLTRLVAYDPGVYGEPRDGLRLAWRLSLAGGGDPVEALIDAETGALLRRSGLAAEGSGLNGYALRMVDDPFLPNECIAWPFFDSLIGDEAGLSSSWASNPDASLLWWAARENHALWNDRFARSSYDGDGGTVNVGINAGWNPPNAKADTFCGLRFSPGWASRDIYAHEFTHLVTSSTSDLEYSGQSGALNESFSDVMGAVFDPQDWLIGEDRTGPGLIAIRNLLHPATFICTGGVRCPEHVSEYLQTEADNGGVHSNSGIINRAFALMTDGGFFEPVYIQGIGRWKLGHLAVQSFTTMPKNATFLQAREKTVHWAIVWAQNQFLGFGIQDLCDVRNAFYTVGIGNPDLDCDGLEDLAVDTDGDGILDDGDGSDTPGDGPCMTNWTYRCDDNCPQSVNPSQTDSDMDGIGDACDADVDGDGIPDGYLDPCPFVENDPYDWDQDGIPNCLDPDDDNDGVPDDGDGDGDPDSNPCDGLTVDCDDNCRGDANPSQYDGNHNGEGDACDPDYDGDGYYLEEDNCTFTHNVTQQDSDGDGLGDACDDCPDTPDNQQAYTPGIPEFGVPPEPYQPDSDGDGLPDACDPTAFGDLGALIDSYPYSFVTAIRRDGIAHQLELVGDGGGQRADLELPVCAEGAFATDSAYELLLGGMPDNLRAWLEDGRGRVVAVPRPGTGGPFYRGFRYRPRCDEPYRLVFETLDGFAGATILAAARVGDLGTANPWQIPPDPIGDPPPPLPDGDEDGLWDDIDRCPLDHEPTNSDVDGDGFGDPCDTCPEAPNPDQTPPPFPTVRADGTAFVWDETWSFDWLSGPLDGVAEFAVDQAGSGAGEQLPIPDSGVEATYYLFRHATCGTWGSDGRDNAF